MIPEAEDDRLDQSLRSKFEQFAPPPTAKVWPGISPHIGPPPMPRRRRRPVPLPFLFGLTALLAGLGGWLLPHYSTTPTETKRVSVVGRPDSAKSDSDLANSNLNPSKTDFTLAKTGSTLAKTNSSLPNSSSNLAKSSSNSVKMHSNLTKSSLFLVKSNTKVPNPNFGLAILSPSKRRLRAEKLNSKSAKPVADSREAVTAPSVAGEVSVGVAASLAADSLPPTLRPLAALEHQTLVQLPSTATLAAGPQDAENRTVFIGTLRRERAELLRLQRRTDSLLLALGDLPGAASAASAAAAGPQADSTEKTAIKHRWSVLLTATPEQNTLTLQGPENDPLTALRRNHETGRAGFSAAALAEYQLTPRLSVGGGMGYSTFGADLRITNKTTAISVIYDSTTTHTVNVYTSTNQTHSIRIVQVPQLSPIFNGSGQVIRYDTVYVPRQDTVFSTIVQHDTVHTTRKVLTPLISKKETLTTRQLQPNYRFFTVPVLLRYRLSLGPGRWWADVAAGAQLQFFLGGTQVVTDDGETFRTQAITAGNGPFRALNVALSGSLALNYALTNRLSVSVAPSMRWQALSVYKAETGLIQRPTATGLQLGVRFKL